MRGCNLIAVMAVGGFGRVFETERNALRLLRPTKGSNDARAAGIATKRRDGRHTGRGEGSPPSVTRRSDRGSDGPRGVLHGVARSKTSQRESAPCANAARRRPARPHRDAAAHLRIHTRNARQPRPHRARNNTAPDRQGRRPDFRGRSHQDHGSGARRSRCRRFDRTGRAWGMRGKSSVKSRERLTAIGRCSVSERADMAGVGFVAWPAWIRSVRSSNLTRPTLPPTSLQGPGRREAVPWPTCASSPMGDPARSRGAIGQGRAAPPPRSASRSATSAKVGLRPPPRSASRSATQAGCLVAGARHVLRVAAAVLVNTLGRQLQHPI
jgi:hypothetical protein